MNKATAARLRGLIENQLLWKDLTEVMDGSVKDMLTEALNADDEKADGLFREARAAHKFNFKVRATILENTLPADQQEN